MPYISSFILILYTVIPQNVNIISNEIAIVIIISTIFMILFGFLSNILSNHFCTSSIIITVSIPQSIDVRTQALPFKLNFISELNKKDKNRVIKVIKNYVKDNEKEIKKQKQSLDDLKKLLTEEEWFFS